MRIERLDLTRFGGFTDRSIDLTGDGVHVIVGANEAGKTTAMTAIRQLLYGIPPQSAHDYLHAYQDMRIGACLRIDGGESREVVRLKRNVNPLRDADDLPIDETTFARWCHDIDQSVFASLFAIGHDEIASGGAALLESDGDLGRAVFSVSRGTTDLNAVLRALDQRAEGLYKRAGQNPTAQRRHPRVQGAAGPGDRAVGQCPRGHRTGRRSARGRAHQGGPCPPARGAACTAGAARAGQGSPAASGRAQPSKSSAGMRLRPRADSWIPPSNRSSRLAREDRRGARQRAAIARAAIAGVDQKLTHARVDAALLAQREVIADLQAAAGAYRQNLEDLPRRRGALQSAEAGLAGLLAGLPAGCARDAAGMPAISAGEVARIEELAAEFPRRDEQLAQAERQVAATEGRLARLRDDQSSHAAAAGRRSARGCRRAHPVPRRPRGPARRGAAGGGRRAGSGPRPAIARLGLGAGVDPGSLDAAPVPSLEVIRQHRARLDEAARERAGLDQQIVGPGR